MIKILFGINLLFLLAGSTALAQHPFNQDPGNPNLDFVSGDLTNWMQAHGDRGNPFTTGGPLPGGNSHTVVGIYGSNWDGNTGPGGLKRVPEGLSRVVRLGAPAGGGYQNPMSYALQYDITVDPVYPVLFLQLAGVMDKSHSRVENTYYRFNILDAAGNPLLPGPCGGISLAPEGMVTPSGNIYTDPVLSAYTSLPEVGSIIYQPWQSVATDLSAFAGQVVRIVFEHNDCYIGHHGSYIYIAAAMRRITDTVYYCAGASEFSLKPYLPNFSTYQWSNGQTTDSMYIPAPRDGMIVSCTVGSYNECSAVFSYVLKEAVVEADFYHQGGDSCNKIRFTGYKEGLQGAFLSWAWDFGDGSVSGRGEDTLPDPQHTYPGPGDYLVTLTVTDTLGCVYTLNKNVHVSSAMIAAQIGMPAAACVFDTLQFEDNSIPAGRRSWFIDGILQEDTSRVLRKKFDRAGGYEVTLIVSADNGCASSDVRSFRVNELPEVFIEITPATGLAPFSDPSFLFSGPEYAGAFYRWNFGYEGVGAEGRDVRFAYPSGVGEYTVSLEVQDGNGCKNTVDRMVGVMPPDFVIPGAFSPNGDGRNDRFRILNMTNQVLKDFSIYNRFGQLVFQTNSPDAAWDGSFGGRPCEAGVYFYTMYYSVPGMEAAYRLSGDLMLIR